MPSRRRTPRNAPALQAFGTQLRRAREAKELKQTALAAVTNTHHSLVSKIENGRTRCSATFVAIADEYLETNGALVELWEDLTKGGHPVPLWFDWPEIEKDAVELATWEHSAIPGLLQNEEYSRAFLYTDEAIAIRIERQQILMRDESPASLAAFIKKEALYNLVTSKDVMARQLEHLLEMSERPNISIQIVVNDGEPAGVTGGCIVATMEDRSQVAHLDTLIRGVTTDDPLDLAAIAEKMIRIQGKALPVSMSRDAIREAIQTWT